MKQNEDATKELKAHSIERDGNDVSEIVSAIKDTKNLYDDKIQDVNLYCLSTGKADLLCCRQ